MKKTLKVLMATTALFSLSSICFAKMSHEEIDKKAKELVSKMTLDEKLDIIHGNGFNFAAVKRLGVGEVNVSDASMGMRITPWPHYKGKGPSTSFPSAIQLASTWSPRAGYNFAKAVAEEFRARNIHILLGPGINIYRNPLCGRNYEYMGEDPYLVSQMVVPYVKAVRKVGCVPTVKHFVANQSEPHRKASNSVISERALREIYFPGFKAAVKNGDALGIMNAYNLINGEYCGESSWLLKDVLRKEWGFRGFVISDWTSIWHHKLSANSGVDIEMPGGKQTFALSPEAVKKLLKDGDTTMEEIDSKIFHLVKTAIEMGHYDKNWAKPELNDLDAHAKVALNTAREGIVLLKNDNILPIKKSNVKKIAVIGTTALLTPTSGGGSGQVVPNNPVTLWEAFKTMYGDKAVYLPRVDDKKIADADAVIVCVGYNTKLAKKYLAGQQDKFKSIAEEQAAFNNGDKKKASKLDDSEHEGNDRKNLLLPKDDNALINACTKLNKNIIVVFNSGGGIEMPWINNVKGIVWMAYAGQNGATAMAEIIEGKVNPSGKLPITFEKKLTDLAGYGTIGLTWSPKTKRYSHENLPHWGNPDRSLKGEAGKTAPIKYWNIDYKEGIFLGYRYFDKNNIDPQFCFGHGLSYTTFDFSNINIKKVANQKFKVSFTIKNTGKKAGAEVAQLYVSDLECSVPRPVKELKGFKKVFLKPGESKTVTLTLTKSSFSFWSPKTKKWTLEPGQFEILVGSSSRDIKLKKVLDI
jgi:beta-glucosidase